MPPRLTHEPHEFVCDDCGANVISWLPAYDNDQTVCATCSWIRTIPSPDERAKIRGWLERHDR